MLGRFMVGPLIFDLLMGIALIFSVCSPLLLFFKFYKYGSFKDCTSIVLSYVIYSLIVYTCIYSKWFYMYIVLHI